MNIRHGLDTLLRDCASRIVLDKRVLGTGFFVAPGIVLTCAHVIDAAAGSPVSIVTGGPLKNEQFSAAVAAKTDSHYPDLALLTVQAPQHPYVLFCEDLDLDDQVYGYGFSDEYPTGDSANFHYEGPSADHQLLRLKEAQARPGMSGSPLLNLRTGGVCGMLKRTRDRDTDLGGRAIPAWTILSQFDDLRVSQNELRDSNSTWNALLSGSQRELVGISRKQFDLLVFDGQEPSQWKPFGDRTLELFNTALAGRSRKIDYPPPPRRVFASLKFASRSEVFAQRLNDVYGVVVDGNALLQERGGNPRNVRQELRGLIRKIIEANDNIKRFGISVTVILNSTIETDFDYCYDEVREILNTIEWGNCVRGLYVVPCKEALDAQFKNELSRFANIESYQ
jgi:hypothetical protein